MSKIVKGISLNTPHFPIQAAETGTHFNLLLGALGSCKLLVTRSDALVTSSFPKMVENSKLSVHRACTGLLFLVNCRQVPPAGRSQVC